MILDIAGLEKPDYFEFIRDFQETVPAINPLGYYYNGKMRAIDDIDPAVAEMIDNYDILQYANVFDKEAYETPFTELDSLAN